MEQGALAADVEVEYATGQAYPGGSSSGNGGPAEHHDDGHPRIDLNTIAT